MPITTLTSSNTFAEHRARTNTMIGRWNDLGEASAITITGGDIDGISLGANTPVTAAYIDSLEINTTINLQGATVLLDNDQISGDKINGGTISSVLVELSGAPTIGAHATTKTYVDGLVSALESSIDSDISALTIFKTISVSGQSDIVADSATDTLTIAAGSNISLTTNASTDTLTIAVSGLGTASAEAIGTSGNTVPKNNTANTFSANQTVSLSGSNASLTVQRTSTGASDLILLAGSGQAYVGSVGAYALGIMTNNTTRMTVGASGGLVVGSATGGNQGDGTINATNLYKNGTAVPMLADDQTWSGAQRGAITALSDGATITPNFNDGNNFTLTLGGNRTLANPTNQVAGQSGVIFINQDGAGGRTLAYGSDWLFPGGVVPTLSTASNAKDVLSYFVVSSGVIYATLIKAFG